VTGFGEVRDQVVVLSSDAIVVCGMSAGTAGEASIAIKSRTPLVLLRPDMDVQAFFQRLGGDGVRVATTPKEAMEVLGRIVNDR